MLSLMDNFTAAFHNVLSAAESPVATIRQQVWFLLELCRCVYPVTQDFKEHRLEMRKFLAGPNTTKLLKAIEKICLILCGTFRKTYVTFRPGDQNFFEQMYYLRRGLLFVCVEFYTPNKFNVECAAEKKWLLRLEKILCRCLKNIRIIMKTILVIRAKSFYASRPHSSMAMAATNFDLGRHPPEKWYIRGDDFESFPHDLCMKFRNHVDVSDFFSAQDGFFCSYCQENDFLNENFIISSSCPHLYCVRCFSYLRGDLDSRCCVPSCSRAFLLYSDRRSFELFKQLTKSEGSCIEEC